MILPIVWVNEQEGAKCPLLHRQRFGLMHRPASPQSPLHVAV